MINLLITGTLIKLRNNLVKRETRMMQCGY